MMIQCRGIVYYRADKAQSSAIPRPNAAPSTRPGGLDVAVAYVRKSEQGRHVSKCGRQRLSWHTAPPAHVAISPRDFATGVAIGQSTCYAQPSWWLHKSAEVLVVAAITPRRRSAVFW